MSFSGLLDCRHDAIGVSPDLDETGRTSHRATLVPEELGEDGFDDILGHAQVEAVTAARPTRGPPRQARSRVGAQSRPSDLHRLVEKAVDESQRFEDLDRPFVHDRGAVPAERRIMGVDQQAVDIAPTQLCRQQRPVGPAPTTKTAGSG